MLCCVLLVGWPPLWCRGLFVVHSVGHTGSLPNSGVAMRRAWLLVRWVAAREGRRVLPIVLLFGQGCCRFAFVSLVCCASMRVSFACMSVWLAGGLLPCMMLLVCRWRPYRVECTGSLPTSEVKRRRARLVLGWGTAREALRVLLAFQWFVLVVSRCQ